MQDYASLNYLKMGMFKLNEKIRNDQRMKTQMNLQDSYFSSAGKQSNNCCVSCMLNCGKMKDSIAQVPQIEELTLEKSLIFLQRIAENQKDIELFKLVFISENYFNSLLNRKSFETLFVKCLEFISRILEDKPKIEERMSTRIIQSNIPSPQMLSQQISPKNARPLSSSQSKTQLKTLQSAFTNIIQDDFRSLKTLLSSYQQTTKQQQYQSMKNSDYSMKSQLLGGSKKMSYDYDQSSLQKKSPSFNFKSKSRNSDQQSQQLDIEDQKGFFQQQDSPSNKPKVSFIEKNYNDDAKSKNSEISRKSTTTKKSISPNRFPQKPISKDQLSVDYVKKKKKAQSLQREFDIISNQTNK